MLESKQQRQNVPRTRAMTTTTTTIRAIPKTRTVATWEIWGSPAFRGRDDLERSWRGPRDKTLSTCMTQHTRTDRKKPVWPLTVKTTARRATTTKRTATKPTTTTTLIRAMTVKKPCRKRSEIIKLESRRTISSTTFLHITLASTRARRNLPIRRSTKPSTFLSRTLSHWKPSRCPWELEYRNMLKTRLRCPKRTMQNSNNRQWSQSLTPRK
mmetsp:Transcript_6260/g.17636  ORF Transcript_6260/g.17636 Transcript_6260/m.17636 type:complete len:212 (+) Transcript_6260:649-1284(+)